MFRLSVVCAALIVPVAVAAPVPREELRPQVMLAGSLWTDEGEGDNTPTVYDFHSDGRLTLSYNGHTYPHCGTWQQHGTRVYWETNNRYYEFEGKLTGTTITGRSWNVKGGKWSLVVRRTKAPPCD